jgi:hypothetical protein
MSLIRYVWRLLLPSKLGLPHGASGLQEEKKALGDPGNEDDVVISIEHDTASDRGETDAAKTGMEGSKDANIINFIILFFFSIV